MPADVAALEHAAVQRDRLDTPLDQPLRLGPGGLLVEHPVHQPALDQPSERAAESVVVGSAFKADVRQPVKAVGQQRLGSAIALLLMLTQDQTGEKLRLGEAVAATEPAGALRQQRQRQFIRLTQHRPW